VSLRRIACLHGGKQRGAVSVFGVWLLGWVLSEARLIFAFELRGGCGVVLYQVGGRVAIAGDYEVQMCGLTGMTGGRGIYGAPKAAREACHPGSTAGP
jgi:hypothetical protein